VDNTLQSTALSARNEKKVCIYMNTAAAAAARHASHFTGDDYRRDSKRALKVIRIHIIKQKIASLYPGNKVK
jgi:hypothetical protein